MNGPGIYRHRLWLAALGLLSISAEAKRPTAGLGSYEEPAAESSATPAEVKLSQCLVSLIGDVKVPARAAGVLARLDVREGQIVEADERLAQIDDARAVLELRMAVRQHALAKLQAENDVDVRHAAAQSAVAGAESDEAKAANQLSAGAVAAAEVRRLELAYQRSKLGIEQAGMEREVAGLTRQVRAAELKKARHEVGERHITAPIAGVVVQIVKQPGEWVQAGDTVLRLVRLDRLRVEGFVDASQVGDDELIDGQVRLEVQRHRGRRDTFAGKVVYVNPLVEAGGNYRVWAEVENRQENGRWVLRPGMEAKLTIALRGPGGATAD